jgi:hypothetical protein
VDNSPGAADPEAAAAGDATVVLVLVLVLVPIDRGGHPFLLVPLERVGRVGSERAVRVGDVPAEPVVLDRGGGLLPAVAVRLAWRSGPEHGVEVWGWVGGEVSDAHAAVVA